MRNFQRYVPRLTSNEWKKDFRFVEYSYPGYIKTEGGKIKIGNDGRRYVLKIISDKNIYYFGKVIKPKARICIKYQKINVMLVPYKLISFSIKRESVH